MSQISEGNTIQEALRQCVISAMRELGISRATLARKLGVSRAAVTQAFDEGWTIERFQQIVEAIGAKISIKLTLPPEEECKFEYDQGDESGYGGDDGNETSNS